MQLQISYIHSNILYIECMKNKSFLFLIFIIYIFMKITYRFPFCEKKHKKEIFMSLKRDII